METLEVCPRGLLAHSLPPSRGSILFIYLFVREQQWRVKFCHLSYFTSKIKWKEL